MKKLFESFFDGKYHCVVLGENEPDIDDEDADLIREETLLLAVGFKMLIKKYNLEVIEETETFVRYQSRDRQILDKLDLLIQNTATPSEIQRAKPIGMPEAAEYLGISKRALYKLTSNRQIPFSKSQGKNYFTLDDLNDFMTKNRVASMDEIKRKARDRSI